MKKNVLNVAAGIAALAMCAGAPSVAHALASWSTAVDVSASGFLTSDPEIAIDADGVMTAIWSHVGASTKTIQVSTSSDGQDWTEPVDVSPIGHEAIEPHLVLDRTGQATAIWTDTTGADSIWTSKREWGETSWSTPVRLSVEGENSGEAQIVVDSNGDFTTILNNRDAHKIQVRTSDDGVTWDAIVTLDTNSSSYLGKPQIAVDGSGRVTAVWVTEDSAPGDSAGSIVSRSSESQGVWDDVTTLSAPNADSNTPRVAVTESGLATATWFSDFLDVQIHSRSSQDGGTWTAAVGHGAGGGRKPNVSLGASGTLILSFYDDENGSIVFSSSQDGVQWGSEQTIDGYADDYSYGVSSDHVAKVIADSSGQLTAVWMRDYTGDPDYPYYRVTSSTSADGVTWTEPVELAGTSSYSVNLVVNSDCRVTALFELSDGTENTVQSRTLDHGGCPGSGGGAGGDSGPKNLAFTGIDNNVVTSTLFAGLALVVVGGVAIRHRSRIRLSQHSKN